MIESTNHLGSFCLQGSLSVHKLSEMDFDVNGMSFWTGRTEILVCPPNSLRWLADFDFDMVDILHLFPKFNGHRCSRIEFDSTVLLVRGVSTLA